MKTVKYNEIREYLKTGDIILFSGNGFVSNCIKLFTLSKWSHVGIVLKLNEYDFVALWESTTLSSLTDLATGKKRKGVQLVQLSERIASYDGHIGLRMLSHEVNMGEHLLCNLRRDLTGKKYERSKAELIKSTYDWILGKNKQDLSSIFCSELVAEAYKELGLIDNHKPSNEYTPKDFAKIKKLNYEMTLSYIIEVEN